MGDGGMRAAVAWRMGGGMGEGSGMGAGAWPPGLRFQRLTGVRTGRLTLRWARCWPRLTPALGQVLE